MVWFLLYAIYFDTASTDEVTCIFEDGNMNFIHVMYFNISINNKNMIIL